MARDPARIPETLQQLQQLWEAYPDLRLGQLLMNFVAPAASCPELHTIEDDELVRKLIAQTG